MPISPRDRLVLDFPLPQPYSKHIEALEKKGFLRRGESGGSRALQWTARSKKLLTAIQDQSEIRSAQNAHANSKGIEIPLLGTIAAGYPIEVYPSQKTFEIPRSLFKKQSPRLG